MDYITFGEASKLTGISSMTIRRYAFKLLKSRKEKLRSYVMVLDNVKANEAKYKIAKIKVLKKWGALQSEPVVNNVLADSPIVDINNKITDSLQGVIKTLTDQLTAKDEQINSLNTRLQEAGERLREVHILLLKNPVPEEKPKEEVIVRQEEPVIQGEEVDPQKKHWWQN